MGKRSLFLVLVVLLYSGLVAGARALAVEKLRFGTSVKGNPHYELPAIAAEEQAFWTQNGLEVTWSPFRAGAEIYQAVAAESLDLVVTAAPANLQAAAGGVPVIIVADSGREPDWFVWVRAESSLKEPKDLKGARIGIYRFGGTTYAYARAVAKALGIEKEVKLTAGGGLLEEMAMLRAGKLDARLDSFGSMANAKYEGAVRELLSVQDYLPRVWLSQSLTARKGFMGRQPEVLRRAVKAYLASTRFVKENQVWSTEKIKSVFRYSDQAARALFQAIDYSRTGRIEPKAIENVRTFLIEYNLVPADKLPPVQELYTNDFVR